MKTTKILALLLLSSIVTVPAFAQLGGLNRALGTVKKAADTIDDLTFTEAEERQIGSEISTKLRNKYGVVQDRAVHRYVTLVGRVVTAGSTRPGLNWTFIVLDTDGVNAFAAPGGFLHITKGALALVRNEAELANVLGHEIMHVTEKHTIEAIRKSKMVSVGTDMTRNQLVSAFAERGYEMVLENQFDRNEEGEADRGGVTLANKAGYAPAGLGAFLTRLADRNKDLKERSGVFASHPEAKARIDALGRVISSAKLTAAALVAPRYGENVKFTLVPIASVAQVAPPTAASRGSSSSSSGGALGLSNRAGIGRDRSSGDTVSSAGSRGVNPDRDAAGGPVKTLVAVTVSAAEIAEFRKGISG